jgi:hypothetical protein
MLFRPVAQRIYHDVKTTFPERKVVIITSDPSLPAVLDIPAWNTKCFVPSAEFFATTNRRLDEAVSLVARASRDEVIRGVKKMRIFNTWDVLYTAISDWLGILQRI